MSGSRKPSIDVLTEILSHLSISGSRKLSKDVLTEILSHLSVKSLQRSRSVSKVWKALIEGPGFIANHASKPHWHGRLLLVKRCLKPPSHDEVLSLYHVNLLEPNKELLPNLSIPYMKDLIGRIEYEECYEEACMVGPCHGLVCIYFRECFLLCNPILREFKRLPPHNFPSPRGYSTHNAGVGFGVTSDRDYKVVLIVSVLPEEYDPVKRYRRALLYSSSTNSWRQIDYDDIVTPFSVYSSTCGVFLNRACHWHAQDNHPYTSEYMILTFDVGTEVFGLLEYSDCMKIIEGEEPSLLLRNQCLSSTRTEYSTKKILIEIWEMKEYGVKESWTKLLRIGQHVLATSFLCYKNDDCLLVESGNGFLGSCGLKANDFEDSQIQGEERSLQAVAYDGSFLSVNHVIKS